MTRRVAISLLFLLSCTVATAADARERLVSMQQYLKSLGRYEVKFSVELNNGNESGYYMVDAENFFLRMEPMEVYVCNGVRYEVDNSKKEVTIENASSSPDDILSRPNMDFTSLLEKYDATLSENGNEDDIVLKARNSTRNGETIHIIVKRGKKYPSVIRYESKGGSIGIRLDEVQKIEEELVMFNNSRYSDYEIFDLR